MPIAARTIQPVAEFSFPVSLLREDRLTKAKAALSRLARPSGPAVPLGLPGIDARLPGRGLQPGLHEIAGLDYRSLPAAWGFLLALVRTVAAARRGLVFWPLLKSQAQDFGLPYGPGLKRFGFDPGRFLFARALNPRDALWAMEEALRLGGLAAVMGARERMDLTMSRRLQLAAESSGTPIFLLRGKDDENLSAARTRWRVAPCPASRDRFGLMEHARWRVTLERARGPGGEWIMEWDHAAFSLRLSSAMADRTVRAGEEKKIA